MNEQELYEAAKARHNMVFFYIHGNCRVLSSKPEVGISIVTDEEATLQYGKGEKEVIPIGTPIDCLRRNSDPGGLEGYLQRIEVFVRRLSLDGTVNNELGNVSLFTIDISDLIMERMIGASGVDIAGTEAFCAYKR